jgi:hypothetical protein
MSAEDQDKAMSTIEINTYKSGAGESSKSMTKADCHADVDINIDEGTEESENESMEEGDDSRMKRMRRKRMRSHPTRNLRRPTTRSAWPRGATP